MDFDRDLTVRKQTDEDTARLPGFGSSGYAIPGSENGRMLALVHAKGNMLYALGDVTGASKAFEDAVLIGAGRRIHGVRGLIRKIIHVLSTSDAGIEAELKAGLVVPDVSGPLLLPPDKALRTAKLVFPKNGDLPGLRCVPEGIAKNAAISTTSNSLLSLAKIFQDGMSNAQQLLTSHRRPSGVGDILALYYLSLSLQPSPSTANNVGILLASVPQSVSPDPVSVRDNSSLPSIPGVVPGSGIALALAYYNYGLNLDSRHAHLFTNLGSLLKDIGQLTAAIKMYEQAVACDSTFDIGMYFHNSVLHLTSLTYLQRLQISPMQSRTKAELVMPLSTINVLSPQVQTLQKPCVDWPMLSILYVTGRAGVESFLAEENMTVGMSMTTGCSATLKQDGPIPDG